MAEQYLTIEQAASRLHVHPVTSTPPPVSPLVRALAIIQERDANTGAVSQRQKGDSAADVRAVREAQTP